MLHNKLNFYKDKPRINALKKKDANNVSSSWPYSLPLIQHIGN